MREEKKIARLEAMPPIPLKAPTGEVRALYKNGETWRVLADVCKALGLSNPTVVANRLDEDERAKFDLGRQGKATIINEPGLYSVILRSDKPEATKDERPRVLKAQPSESFPDGLFCLLKEKVRC